MDLGTKYQVIKELGAGAMGRVFKARQVLLKRTVAVKVINPALVESDESRRRFIREAQLSAQLSHPNIVQTHNIVNDIVNEEELTFIVTEFIDGFPLGDLLKKTPVPAISTTIKLVAQLLDGLAHAHAKKIIHRDIKPDNLMINREGVLKIADFGIARVSEGNSTLTKEGVIVGTPLFLAPELIAPKPGQTITTAVDIYATGVLLYRMLTGRYPFVANDVATLLTQHLREKPIKPSMHNADVPQSLSQLTMQMLSKDPNERPTSAKSLAQELRTNAKKESLDFSPDGATSFVKNLSVPLDGEATQPSLPQMNVGAIRKAKGKKKETILPAKPTAASEVEKSRLPYIALGAIIPLLLLIAFFYLSGKSGPAHKRVNPTLNRTSPQQLSIRWQSEKPYRASFRAESLDGKHLSKDIEKTTTRQHILLFDNIRSKYDYRFVLSVGKETIATGAVKGKPDTIDKVYVYRRRETADIDWICAVPIKNPRVIDMEKNLTFPAKIQRKLPDGSWIYSARIEQRQPSPRSYRFTGVTSSPIVKNLACLNETLSFTPTRPTFEMLCLRHIDERLTGRERKRFVKEMSSKHKPKIDGVHGRYRARYDTAPIVADNELITSHRSGEIIAYELPTQESMRWPRPFTHLKERWAFRDCADNYDGPSSMSIHGNKLMFIQNRHPLNLHSSWWGMDSGKFADKINKMAVNAIKAVTKDKEILDFDAVYVLNRKERFEQYQALLKTKKREEILSSTSYQKTNKNWQERYFKFLCASSNETLPHKWFDCGADWCLAKNTDLFYVRIYRQHPEPSDITATLNINDLSNKTCRLLSADMNYVNQPPLYFDKMIYFLSIPERQRNLKHILREKRFSFIKAVSTDPSLREEWRYDIGESIELSRLYYQHERGRVFVSSPNFIYVVDGKARAFRKIPKDFKITIEEARKAITQNDDISNFYGLCFTSTPILLASPEDKKAGKRFIMISVGVESESTAYFKGLTEECQQRGLILFEIDNNYKIVKALPVKSMGHREDVLAGKAAGSTEHIVHQDDKTGLIAYVQNDHILVIDPNKSPPNHILLETTKPGFEVEFVTIHDNAIYFTFRKGEMMRAAFSPLRR